MPNARLCEEPQPEVFSCQQNGSALILREVQHEVRVWLLAFFIEKTPVVKQMRAKTRTVTFCKNCFGMIASVSTLAASSGTTRPVCLINFSATRSLFNVANVGEMSGHNSSGSHCRADQMRAPAGPLAAFKVTVAGGCTTFARIQTGRCSSPDTLSSQAVALF